MENNKLKHNASILSSLKDKGAGFVVPSNYFDGMENRFFSIQMIEKSNSNIGFVVPENYFDTIESKVFSKLELKKNTSIFQLQKFWISAAIAAMVILTFGIYNYQKKTTEFNLAEMENWIDNGTVNLNSYEIASAYDAEFEQIELSDFIIDEELEEYLQNDINEYLYNE